MKKYSILGVSLLAVSAIAAAFAPAKKSDAKSAAINGVHTVSSNPFGAEDFTCRSAGLGEDPNCSYTVTEPNGASATTGVNGQVNSLTNPLLPGYTASGTTAIGID